MCLVPAAARWLLFPTVRHTYSKGWRAPARMALFLGAGQVTLHRRRALSPTVATVTYSRSSAVYRSCCCIPALARLT